MVAEGGMKLHPDTARAIAEEQARRARPWRPVLAVLTIVMIGLAAYLAR
jgi:hypothetical protein